MPHSTGNDFPAFRDAEIVHTQILTTGTGTFTIAGGNRYILYCNTDTNGTTSAITFDGTTPVISSTGDGVIHFWRNGPFKFEARAGQTTLTILNPNAGTLILCLARVDY